MANATEKQVGYLRDLVQGNMVNRVWTIRGFSTEQTHKLHAECVRLIRSEIEAGIDAGRASTLIDAAKEWPSGPRAMLIALKFDNDSLKTLLA